MHVDSLYIRDILDEQTTGGLSMKQLGIRFARKQVLQIDDISTKTNIDKSQVARAAMQLGLEVLRTSVPPSYTQAEYVAINNMKALN